MWIRGWRWSDRPFERVPWSFLERMAGRASRSGGSRHSSRPGQRRWAPLYREEAPLRGERKYVKPTAARVAPGGTPRPRRFGSASHPATPPQ
jgi:hypothetical protein